MNTYCSFALEAGSHGKLRRAKLQWSRWFLALNLCNPQT
ncbi:hypothetical protein SMACR_12727 [Sordaria macrospora]|uniref:Uncharacterized protein n=1 Tax=Sordaria macrospora TaxID=5147 RepID=A0A8S9A7E9_SORMA|nr:hypothetical protein SMACR_12727 [Sordaria macrospora]